MKVLSFIIMWLNLAEPASFTSLGKLEVRDRRGNSFYESPHELIHSFNLPAGRYHLNNDECTVWQKREFTPFPKIEDCMQIPTSPRGIKYNVDDNPNKASYFPDFHCAVVDPMVADHEYEPCIIACMTHEEGHTDIRSGPGYSLDFDTAEHYCDCYAYNKMAKNGYNPEQVKKAFNILLGEDNSRAMKLSYKINQANGGLLNS